MIRPFPVRFPSCLSHVESSPSRSSSSPFHQVSSYFFCFLILFDLQLIPSFRSRIVCIVAMRSRPSSSRIQTLDSLSYRFQVALSATLCASYLICYDLVFETPSYSTPHRALSSCHLDCAIDFGKQFPRSRLIFPLLVSLPGATPLSARPWRYPRFATSLPSSAAILRLAGVVAYHRTRRLGFMLLVTLLLRASTENAAGTTLLMESWAKSGGSGTRL